jgi:hypothetical protein
MFVKLQLFTSGITRRRLSKTCSQTFGFKTCEINDDRSVCQVCKNGLQAKMTLCQLTFKNHASYI